MTREQTKYFVDLLTAYASGKTIQVKKTWNNGKNYSWEDLEEFTLLVDCHDPESYRVKPEPKVVSFTLKDTEILGKKIKMGHRIGIITGMHSEGITSGLGTMTYDFLKANSIFADTGEPCGKIIEE